MKRLRPAPLTDSERRKPMIAHFPLMVPGSKTTSPSREVSAPYDGALLATVDTADSGVVEQALATAYALYRNRDA